MDSDLSLTGYRLIPLCIYVLIHRNRTIAYSRPLHMESNVQHTFDVC